LAIKICQLSLFGGKQKDKVVISLQISFDCYAILIRSFLFMNQRGDKL